MTISKKLVEHLEKNKVRFDIVEHKKVYTAYDLAQTLGEKLEKIGKSLLVQVELPELKKNSKKHFIIVVPASYRVDLKKVGKALKATKVELASEKVLKKLGIELGALTSFGSLHKIEVLLDKALLKTRDVILNAGSFTDSLRMKVRDLHKLENALIAAVGVKAKEGKSKKKVASKKTIAPKRKVTPKKKVPAKKKRTSKKKS